VGRDRGFLHLNTSHDTSEMAGPARTLSKTGNLGGLAP
jgi:hypothetical protein